MPLSVRMHYVLAQRINLAYMSIQHQSPEARSRGTVTFCTLLSYSLVAPRRASPYDVTKRTESSAGAAVSRHISPPIGHAVVHAHRTADHRCAPKISTSIAVPVTPDKLTYAVCCMRAACLCVLKQQQQR